MNSFWNAKMSMHCKSPKCIYSFVGEEGRTYNVNETRALGNKLD